MNDLKTPVSLLPLRSGMLFPGTTMTLPVGRARSVALLEAHREGDLIAVVSQRDANVSDPTEHDLFARGTLARIVKRERTRDRSYRVTLEGVTRWQLGTVLSREPYFTVEGSTPDETDSDPVSSRLLAASLKTHISEIASKNGGTLTQVNADDETPGLVADQVASLLGLPVEKEHQVLSLDDVNARLKRVTDLVAESKAMADLKSRIDQDVRREVNKHQRDALLREQIKALRKELGEEGEGDDANGRLRKRIEDANLPDEVRTAAERELRRLEGMPAQNAETHVIRTWLEWVADLPWNVRAPSKDDLDAVSARLDADHAGLDDVKKRILEHMAVLKLSGNPRGTILCLAGPPGVGKTSLGQSIAEATGRPFVRIALGGVRDEAEVRGHRRTYVGALPGRVIHAMKKAGAKNAVVLLDEIDKLFSGWSGSPEAALLEVLDPEQNKTFTDHYMELPFDLSEALFVVTANDLSALSAPLRDRLEIIEVQGYTLDEKVDIARKHLVPKHLKEHNLGEGMLTVTEAALRAVVRDYTREAGVRQLGREITRLCRAVALDIARQTDTRPSARVIDEGDLQDILGKVKYVSDVAERTAAPGVATGLAWTPVGGDILFIETSRMRGKGALEITGQLGDVMKESARAAMTYVRSNAEALGLATDVLDAHDVHIHVPAGAVPKDGPSAGVTIFTALVSLLSGRRVRNDTAMTGECTLRGRVMPVGGIKAKVLAAHRAGITHVILPAKNRRDLDDVPSSVREAMRFTFADEMHEVLAAALESPDAPRTLGEPVLSPAPRDGATPQAH